MKQSAIGGALALITAIGLSIPAATSAPAAPAAPPPAPNVAAARSAEALIHAKAPALHVGADDRFIAHPVITGGNGLRYAPFDRTYHGLPVVGGDIVVVTDAAGHVRSTSAGQAKTLSNLSTSPTISAARAKQAVRGQLPKISKYGTPELVVYALSATPTLAWSVRVAGTSGGDIAAKDAYVDAASAKVLGSRDRVLHGTGNSAYNGPNPVSIATTHTGSNYVLQDPSIRNLPCQDFSTKATFTKTTDSWGNGNPTSKETGCVDALFAAQTENRMLSSWLGRNSFDGSGGGWPIRVGLNDINAYYDGTQVAVGHNTANQWISSIDVVAHEFGHGVDDHTPGGISGGNTQEFVADTFGASTEWYANEPSPYDTPDFTVGEEVNLSGNGPIRYMYDPSRAGDDNCYSSSVPTEEVHAAAGPGNHWFYLLAEGNSPTNGQPASPTCNGSAVTGVGTQKAAQIMYNAMLMKTSASSYLKYRLWTLTAAKNLFPSSCTEFNAVKKAWDAVSVPAQSGEPTCGSTPPPPPPPPGGNLLKNPGFESGAVNWTGTAGPITNNSGRPAHAGSWKMWLGGNGTTSSENESQTVTIPATAASASLSFWIRIDTSESGSTAYDHAKIQIISGGATTTLASYSNVNANNTYVQKTFNLTQFAGKSVTVKFSMTEDSSLQTSFVVDDTALTAG